MPLLQGFPALLSAALKKLVDSLFSGWLV